MRVALTTLLALAAWASGSGCSGSPGPGLDIDDALAQLPALAVPRPAESAAAQDTIARIEQLLARDGITVEKQVVGTVDLPEINVLGAMQRTAHSATVGDPNLLVRFGPPGKALLFMAHYDSVEGSPGAIDNAASVLLLIELARVLHHAPPAQPVILAFTAAEEIGLVGAEALAAEIGDDVGFAIALDLVGGDGELVVNGAGMLIGRAELRWIAAAADNAGATISVPAAHRVVSRWWPQAERSDHGPFTRRGVRALHFYNRGHDAEWIDLAYHSGRDVPARVDRRALEEMGRLLRALVASPVPAHGGDGYWLPFVRGVVVPRVALVALELVLVLVVIVTLVLSRTGLLAWFARSRDAQRGPALLLGAACYIAAVLAAFGIERVVNGEHLARWVHAPGRALIATVLVIGGMFGLATRIVARFAPWRGEGRFLAVAALLPLAIGIAWLAAGAAEVAWVWLVPAAAIAIAPLTHRLFAPIAVVLAALPIVLVPYPDRLREAIWNGFLPVTIPLAALVGLLGISVAAALAWALRRRAEAGPMGTLVLGLGCGLAVIAGIVVAVTGPEPCTPVEFVRFLLACERV